MIGARTRLFHAIVGLGLAGAGVACGGSTSPAPAETSPDAAPTPDAGGTPADAGTDAFSAPPLGHDAGGDTLDAALDADAWTSVPIK